MEEMKKDITKKMAEVFEFIGVDDLGFPPKMIDPILRRDRTRYEDIKLSRSEKFYRVWNNHPLTLSGKFRKELIQFYKPQNEKLFEFLGYKIKEWTR